jgi:hypothetical protein
MEEQESNQSSRPQILLEWSYPEYTLHHRSHSWYFWYGIIAAALIVLSLFSDNYLFAVIIILSSIILFLQNWEHPKTMDLQLRTDGLYLGEKLYSYRDIAEFWIAYDPPHVSKVYLAFESTIVPMQGIPLGETNPLQVREILLKFVPENLDREDEPGSDIIARVLKI